MKCFIHLEQEAIAACRQCGKGMCADCSSYSNHSGICPECRLNGFKKEVAQKRSEYDELHKEQVWAVVKAVLLCWLIVPIFVGLYRFFDKKKQKEDLLMRIGTLNKEIKKLENVRARRGGAAFV